jgi:hypothetical protein
MDTSAFDLLIAHLPQDERRRLPALLDRLMDARNKAAAALKNSPGADQATDAALGQLRAVRALLATLVPLPERWGYLQEMKYPRSRVPRGETNRTIVGEIRAFRDFVQAGVQGHTAAPQPAVNWSQPAAVKQWTSVFGVSRNTMAVLLKTGKVRSRQLTRQSYQVAIEDIPAAHRRRFQQPP